MKKLLTLILILTIGYTSYSQDTVQVFKLNQRVNYGLKGDSIVTEFAGSAVFYEQNDSSLLDIVTTKGIVKFYAIEKLESHSHTDGGFGVVYIVRSIIGDYRYILELEYNKDQTVRSINFKDDEGYLEIFKVKN